MDNNQADQFLQELNKLTRKYKISIFGCGCCGSPFLSPLTDKELSFDFKYHFTGDYENLTWEKTKSK